MIWGRKEPNSVPVSSCKLGACVVIPSLYTNMVTIRVSITSSGLSPVALTEPRCQDDVEGTAVVNLGFSAFSGRLHSGHPRLLRSCVRTAQGPRGISSRPIQVAGLTVATQVLHAHISSCRLSFCCLQIVSLWLVVVLSGEEGVVVCESPG